MLPGARRGAVPGALEHPGVPRHGRALCDRDARRFAMPKMRRGDRRDAERPAAHDVACLSNSRRPSLPDDADLARHECVDTLVGVLDLEVPLGVQAEGAAGEDG
jgi:hypothetical protein